MQDISFSHVDEATALLFFYKTGRVLHEKHVFYQQVHAFLNKAVNGTLKVRYQIINSLQKFKMPYNSSNMFSNVHDTQAHISTESKDLKQFVLETGDTELIEANPHDKYWGVGLALKDTNQLKDKNQWKGLNKLGNILNDIRVAL